ncbi:MAG: metallophosphoesterase [Stappiaceae bacterium]
MFKLAHISDPHLGPLPNPQLHQLVSKRVLGYINWQRNRAHSLTDTHLNALIKDLKAHKPDHIAITGDLVNIALPQEITGAQRWLQQLGDPKDISVIPGNHDAYVPGALKKVKAAWAPYMLGDGLSVPATFPYCRKRGHVALVGTSSARASAPLMATGYFSLEQADRLQTLLTDLGSENCFRIVMIHHPPFPNATHWHKRLVHEERFRAVIAKTGAELVLHGHTHIDSLAFIEGASGKVPVVGVPSASNAPGGRRPGARYNQFDITHEQNRWSCTMTERGFTDAGKEISEIRNRQLIDDGQTVSNEL